MSRLRRQFSLQIRRFRLQNLHGLNNNNAAMPHSNNKIKLRFDNDARQEQLLPLAVGSDYSRAARTPRQFAQSLVCRQTVGRQVASSPKKKKIVKISSSPPGSYIDETADPLVLRGDFGIEETRSIRLRRQFALELRNFRLRQFNRLNNKINRH